MVAPNPHNVPVDAERPLEAQSNPGRPSASGANALWLAITLLNVILLILLLPSSIRQNETILFIIKVVSIIAAAGAFAAGLVWFRDVLTSLPSYRWFKVLQVIALGILVLMNLAKLPVIPLYPVLDPGATLQLDDKPQKVGQGPLRVSLRPQKFLVGTPKPDQGKAREYSLGLKDLFFAIFYKYQQRWSPLYAVDIKTRVPNVEVMIVKTDGAFDINFRENPEPSDLNLRFEQKAGTDNQFIYGAGDSQVGSADVIYLPPGEYKFTAHKDGCSDKEIRSSIKGVQYGGHAVDFESLCDSP